MATENLSLVDRPETSPWREIETWDQCIPTIPVWMVATIAHGGYMVEASWARHHMSGVGLRQGFQYRDPITQHVFYCYEQDNAWPIVEWEIPALRVFVAGTNTKPDSHGVPGWTAFLRESLAWMNPAYLTVKPDPTPIEYSSLDMAWAAAQVADHALGCLLVRYIEAAPEWRRDAYRAHDSGNAVAWAAAIISRYNPEPAATEPGNSLWLELLAAWAAARRTAFVARSLTTLHHPERPLTDDLPL